MLPLRKQTHSLLVDILVASLVIKLLTVWFSDTIMPTACYSLLQMSFVYFLTRLLFLTCPLLTRKVLLAMIIILLIRELYLGIFQFFTIHPSNNLLYPITGSFDNPGPYGGFISVCLGILSAYTIKKNVVLNDATFSFYLSKFIMVLSITASFMLLSTQSRSAILAICGSVILLIIGEDRISGKIIPFVKNRIIWISVITSIILCGAYLIKKPSADGRFFMDKICTKAIIFNGWGGAGFGQFGGAYGLAQENYFEKQIIEKGKNDLDWSCINERERLIAECPTNAFNEYLFVGVENGPIAMFLFICIVVIAIVISFKENSLWCYGLMAFALFALFSYPIHVLQFQILFPVLLASCLSDKSVIDDRVLKGVHYSSKKELSTYMIESFLTFFIIGLSISIILKIPDFKQKKQVEQKWLKIDDWHQREYYDFVVEECESLLPYMKNNHHFLFAYGQSLNKKGMYEKSDSILLMGTAISSDPMFWNVMGNNSLALGRYREAEDRYKHAFYMIPNRMYPLYLLAKLYYEEGDIPRFLEMYSRIELFKPKIESINTERLRDELLKMKTNYYDTGISDCP